MENEMSKRCEWFGHSWKNDGEPSIIADLMTQPLKCSSCGETKGDVGSWSDDPPPKIAKLKPAFFLIAAFVVVAMVLKWS